MTASSAAWPTLAALVRAVVSRERTSLSLVEECHRRIAELDSRPDGLGAVLALNPEARSLAEAADEHLERTGLQRGPLHGISSLYLLTARDDIDAFLASRPELGTSSFLDLYDAGVFPESIDLAEVLATRSRSSARLRAERLSNRHRLRDTVVRVMTDAGLPVGLELLGRPGADGPRLGLGSAVESALRGG